MTKPGTMLKQRTICLVPIPFTDLTSSKRRPVLIISNNNYNHNHEDIVVMAITSSLREKVFSVIINQADMKTGILKKESSVRIDKIYTLSKKLVIKAFGRLSENKYDEIINRLHELVQNS